jgi:radical SAM protein with 4Fe4S-binding SPASM domain
MSTELYKKAITEYDAMGGGYLSLIPIVGDPLIDKDILERIRFAASFPSINDIRISTNGISLDKVDTKELLESGLQWVVISTSPDETMFKRLYRSDKYSQMLKNALNILEVNEQLNCPVRIVFVINVDISPFKTRRLPDYKKLSSHKCDIFIQYYYDDWGGDAKVKSFSEAMKIRPLPKKDGPCALMMSNPKILVDGSVTACGCRDYSGDSGLILGNIKDQTLSEIWTNGKLEHIYQQFTNGDCPDICKNCRVYQNGKHFVASKGGKKSIENAKASLLTKGIGK